MQRPFRVGRNCDAWCTKCKKQTEHVIVALVGEAPKRVECCSCGSQHNYRLPAAARPKAKRAKAAPRKSSPRSWKAQIDQQGEPARGYSISETFEQGDFMTHPRFGEGVVQKVMPGRKIEVLFETGMHLLVHQR